MHRANGSADPWTALVASAMALLACQSTKAEPSPTAKPAELAEPQPATASRAEAATTPPASGDAAGPGWPDGTDHVTLTWVIYPVVFRVAPGDAEEPPSIPVRRVELVARAGAASQRIATEVQFSVVYAISTQNRCRGIAEGARVAELAFNGGGNDVLVVERSAGYLTLTEERSSDGLCEPSPCPVQRTRRGSLTVPEHAQLEERFHIVDGPSNEHDEGCEGPLDAR